MKQLKQSDLKKIRKKYHKKQKGICPVLKQKFPESEMVVDHKHKKKSDKIGEDGKSLVRGVIQRQANVIEGKLTNAYTRYGLQKFDVSLPDFLRNLADYLENPPLLKKKFIHPSEAPKPKKLMKSSFNKLIKELTLSGCPKNKLPVFPKSGKMTIKLASLYEQFNVIPGYYK